MPWYALVHLCLQARLERQRLAAMTEEEVLKEIEEAEKHAGMSNPAVLVIGQYQWAPGAPCSTALLGSVKGASAKLLLSGYKVEALLEAQEGPKDKLMVFSMKSLPIRSEVKVDDAVMMWLLSSRMGKRPKVRSWKLQLQSASALW